LTTSEFSRPDKIVFTEKRMDQLYDLAVKCRNNSMSKEELITKLRGGCVEDWIAAFGIIIAIITVLNNVDAFQVPPAPGAIVPPHLQWFYGNHFGYGKKAGKKQPSSGSWKYTDVMRELDKQSSKRTVEIQIADQMYTIKNSSRQSADELQFVLAEKVYDSIR